MRRSGGSAAMLFGGGRSLVTVDEGWRRWFWLEMKWCGGDGATTLINVRGQWRIFSK